MELKNSLKIVLLEVENELAQIRKHEADFFLVENFNNKERTRLLVQINSMITKFFH
jgi:hypothetical protein